MEYFYRTVNKSVGAGINTLMSISDGLGPSIFLSKDGKSASYEGRDGWKSCLFPARVGTLPLDAILFDSTFLYLYFDLACKQLCFPPGKSINRRNESTTSEHFAEFSENLVRSVENLWRTFLIIFQEHFRTFSKLLRTALKLLRNEC